MGTATRKAQARNATRQRLIAQTHRKAEDGATAFEKSEVQASIREAKFTLKSRANTHVRRETTPGEFHNPRLTARP